MQKQWLVSPPITQEFQDQFPEIPKIILQLLFNRGLTTQQAIDEFLNPDYGEDIHDPFLFRNMEKAVARILDAISKKETIVIYGDYDADGVSGSAILASVLRDLGATTDIYIPHRETEGYGVNMNAVKTLAEKGAHLLITCDCGISNTEEIAYAEQQGIHVIITDHHTIPEKLPPAFAIIHPLIPGETYPFHGLAGGGVAFKLAQALLRKAKTALSKEGTEKWLLDLVAISTIADMVPLVGENRTLVRYGLIVLNKTRRLGLQKLIAALPTKSATALNTGTVAWYLVPRINAAGRMNHANLAYALLMSSNDDEVDRIVKELNSANAERQRVTQQLVQEAKELLGDHPNDPLLFVLGQGWPLGLVGLVAGKISEHYGRPTIIMTDREGEIAGSGRSVSGFNMIEALQTAAKHFRKFGGHPMACGFTVKDSNRMEEMKNDLIQLAAAALDGEAYHPTLSVDAEVTLSQLTWEFYEDIEKFEPFGEGNPRPRYVVRGAVLDACDVVGSTGKHLRIALKQGETHCRMIGFNFGSQSKDLHIGDVLDCVFEVDVNEWNGNRELQYKIVDLRGTS